MVCGGSAQRPLDSIEEERVRRIAFILLVGTGVLLATAFHPYGVKSGKITFEKRRYGIHTTLHIDANTNVQGSRSNPYYVEEEIVYYWDNYGDIAFEEAYRVADFGGKPLPKKVKKYEKLWKGAHRYYYNVKKHRLSDDPYYIRKACLEAEKFYQLAGWFGVIYPQAVMLNSETVATKMTRHYRESAYSDYYLYNGIVLREVNYATKQKNGKEVRFEPETERIAIKVEENVSVDPERFHPKWLKEK